MSTHAAGRAEDPDYAPLDVDDDDEMVGIFPAVTSDEEDDDDGDEATVWLASLAARAMGSDEGRTQPAAGMKRLPVERPHVAGQAEVDMNNATQGRSKRVKCPWAALERGVDAAMLQASVQAHGASVSLQRSGQIPSMAASGGSAFSAAAAAAAGPHGGAAPRLSGFELINPARLMLKRELALGGRPGFSAPEQRQFTCYRNFPRYPQRVVDSLDSRAYIGQYSHDGAFFVAAFQDRRVRVYDTQRNWALVKDVTTRMTRWTVTDTTLSPCQRYLLYTSIMPVVHLVDMGDRWASSWEDEMAAGNDVGSESSVRRSVRCVQSVANVTEVHEALCFDPDATDDWRRGRSFGIWSLQWSGDGREIIAGTNDQSVYVYDIETRRVLARRLEAHADDVNAVTYADESPNTIITGSDDSLIKVWDRRMLGNQNQRARTGGASSSSTQGSHSAAVGVLIGHTEGITHLDAKGDGRHVLSNGKDQSAKLWDLRAMRSEAQAKALPKPPKGPRVPTFHWDYRWQPYPGKGYDVVHPHDGSLQTYRGGHSVLHTLVRAYFSPAATTGQRFIYTGSADGDVYIYDALTAEVVDVLRYHSTMVRDCSWHPSVPQLTTVCWDGSVVLWDCVPRAEGGKELPRAGSDKLNDWY